MCRLVPFWLRNLEAATVEPLAVLVLRHPAEVARSLQARNGFTRGKALRMWLRHVLDAERETRGIRRSFVRYADVLQDWRKAADRIGEDLGLRWSYRNDKSIEAFLAAELRHHREPVRGMDFRAPQFDRAKQAWNAFGALMGPDAGRKCGARETLDRIGSEIESRRP
jgi:hypothetical protein